MGEETLKEVLQKISDKIEKVIAEENTSPGGAPQGLFSEVGRRMPGVIYLRLHNPTGDPNKTVQIDGELASYSISHGIGYDEFEVQFFVR